MQLSSSQVKNLMRRGLRLLVDPDLTAEERGKVCFFFDHRCAYCGCFIADGEGDLDHLVSSSKRGSNHISNRVLSCKPCNAEEKRETAWQEFLRDKCGGKTPTFLDRREKIQRWVVACGDSPVLPEAILEVLNDECRRMSDEYDLACQRIREARASLPKT